MGNTLVDALIKDAMKPLEAKPAAELFGATYTVDADMFESLLIRFGMWEAAERLLQTKKYCEDDLRVIFGIEMEETNE